MLRKSESIRSEKSESNSEENQEFENKIITSIVENLLNHYQLDFRDYAKASFSRRIKHLITIFGLDGPEALIQKIQSEPDFKISLVHEITVGATEMFRDPSFWIAFKGDILTKFEKEEGPIKIWVSGCSSGEEIFSLAIILAEFEMAKRIEILATDLDPLVIDQARKGFYFNHSFVKNSENYVNSKGSKTLDYYCQKGGLGYQMNLSLLDNVRFKCNDLIQENIEEKFDIIFCRNVLIYFNQELQNTVLKKLRFNLKPDSYLALGMKESITWLKESNQFEAIKRYEKIYQLKANGIQP